MIIETSEHIDCSDDMVPFQENDESFEEIARQSDNNLQKIIQLKSIFNNLEWLKNESSLLSISQDTANLEKQWQNDPEKTGLLQIITMCIDHLKTQDKTAEQLIKDNNTDQNFEAAAAPQVETTGVWSKIKNLFSS